MKSFKIPSKSSLFISKKNADANLNSSYNITVGQYGMDEFRGLVEFNLNPRIFDFKIYRADLVIYLTESKIDLNIEAFMMNIARNLEGYNPNTVTWETAPKFFQEAHFSKIGSDFHGNYIMIDVSKILEFWVKNRVSIFGMTLVGLTETSLLYISNTINKKPFLEIYLDDECECPNYGHVLSHNKNMSTVKKCSERSVVNPSSQQHHQYHNAHHNDNNNNNNNNNNSYQNNPYNPNTHQNSQYDYNSDRTDYSQNSLAFPPNIEKTSIDYNNLINTETPILEENTNIEPIPPEVPLAPKIPNPTLISNQVVACGNFISTSGDLLKNNLEAYVKFNLESNATRTNLNISKDGIFLLNKGLYKVDYFINCRSEPFSTVELELDGLSIPISKIQISSSDSPTSASTLINVNEDNMILKLKLSTSNAILINTGICASLTLIKIN